MLDEVDDVVSSSLMMRRTVLNISGGDGGDGGDGGEYLGSDGNTIDGIDNRDNDGGGGIHIVFDGDIIDMDENVCVLVLVGDDGGLMIGDGLFGNSDDPNC